MPKNKDFQFIADELKLLHLKISPNSSMMQQYYSIVINEEIIKHIKML